MIVQVEEILQQIELLLRGGSINGNASADIVQASNSLLNWFSSNAAIEEFEACTESQKVENLNLAVKLHNKTRNLTSLGCSEIKTILKAASAWILSIYGGEKPKLLSVVIKLLSKSSQEMLTFGYDSSLILKGFTAAILFWNQATSLSIEKDLPPVDVQDIKIAVFWAYLEQANILNRGGFKQEDIRKSVLGAMEIVQTLPVRMKFTFAENVMRIGHQAASTPDLLHDSIQYFKIALNSIDGAMLPESSFSLESENDNFCTRKSPEARELKLKAQLSLAFVYMHSNQCDKALACINGIDTAKIGSNNNAAIDRLAHTILYAKFTIFLKDKDTVAAEASLWELLKLPLTPFETALSAVRSLLAESTVHTEQESVRFYKHLAGKYPNDPEFTSIRICHLQSILSNVRYDEKDGMGTNKKALEISNSIIEDHTNQERVLSRENYECLKKIFSERIRWHRSLHHFDMVIGWCDCLCALLSENIDEIEYTVAISLLKVDALLNMRKYEEAVRIAMRVVSTMKNTRTIVMFFKSMLHAKEPTEAVSALLNVQQSNMNKDSEQQQMLLENLSRIILCCYTVQESSLININKRDRTIQLLLSEWIHHYAMCEAWCWVCDTSLADTNAIDADTTETYFSVMCELLSSFLSRTLKSCLSGITVSKVSTKSIADVRDKENQVSIPTNINLCEKNPTPTNTDYVAESAHAVTSVETTVDKKFNDDTVVCESVKDNFNATLTLEKDSTSSLHYFPMSQVLDATDFQPSPLQHKQTISSNNENSCEPTLSDFRITMGYPDCISTNATIDGGGKIYTFLCPLTVLISEVLGRLEECLAVVCKVETQGIALSNLGPLENLHWLSVLAWNMATLLLKKKLCVFEPSIEYNYSCNDEAKTDITSSDEIQRLLTSARLYELSDHMNERLSRSQYHAVNENVMDDRLCDQAFCLLLACSARIDAETLNISEHNQLTKAMMCFLEGNLLQARSDAQRAERLLKAHADFEDAKRHKLRRTALVLEFTVLCKLSYNIRNSSSNEQQCQEFISARQHDFLNLTAEELKHCAQVARSERGVAVEVTRIILNYALQACARDICPNYISMGGIYRELIELSPTRRQALERVEEFEQLATGIATNTSPVHTSEVTSATGAVSIASTDIGVSNINKNMMFETDDIDHIVSLSYNYGVTLVDLDQIQLAEKFVSKAMSLLPLASLTLKGWLPKMQDTYAHILQTKTQCVATNTHFDPAITMKSLDGQSSSNDYVDTTNLGSDQFVSKKRNAINAGINVLAKEPAISLDFLK